jgi:hypothetical protein
MVRRFSLWDRFADAGFRRMHAMVPTRVLFTAMLSVIEPPVPHAFPERMAAAPAPRRC